jgi:hypothetical protein
MSCRATCQPPLPPLSPVTCSDCGVSDLHSFYTSTTRGLHLCPTCFGSRIERGMAKEEEPGLPEECQPKSIHPLKRHQDDHLG